MNCSLSNNRKQGTGIIICALFFFVSFGSLLYNSSQVFGKLKIFLVDVFDSLNKNLKAGFCLKLY